MPKARTHADRSKSRVLLFLGAPGSGKGTQSAWLSSQLGIPSLSTGDMLRGEAKRNTPAGLRLREVLASGSLVSDSIVCDAVAARLQRERESGMILDGFPRTLKQAESLTRILASAEMPQPVVFHLHVSRERLVARLTARRHCAECGAIFNLLSRPSARGMFCENDGGKLLQRDDDSREVILRRLTDFETSCAPLVDYYRRTDYHRIDGDRDAELVSAELLRIASPARTRAAA